MFLKTLGQFEQRRRGLEHLFGAFLGRGIKAPAHELGQVAVERAHRGADRHVVVVQDHQQLAVFHTRMVERLKRHAGGHGAVANDGNGVSTLALLAGGQRHAQRGRDAGGRMADAKGVVFALVAAREARQSVQLA